MPAPIWLATPMVSVIALTKMTELIGVLNFGCRRENQPGSTRSQPATMGNRELPVTCTLVDAIVRTVIKIMAMEAIALAIGKSPKDRKSTRLNSSHSQISYAVFCLKKKNILSAPLRQLPQAQLSS